MGGARFRTGAGSARDVDTLAFGAYRREVFDRIGTFDEELVRNQDDEFNLRLTQAGGRIWLDPSICTTYWSRATVRGAFRQYFEYGAYKVRVAQKRRTVPSVRSLVPALLVGGLAAGVAVGLARRDARAGLRPAGRVRRRDGGRRRGRSPPRPGGGAAGSAGVRRAAPRVRHRCVVGPVAVAPPVPFVTWDPDDPANRAMDDQRDELVRSLIEGLGRPVQRTLDLGCGRGEALATFGLPGVGIDVSLVRLRLAPGPVAQADARMLPFPDHTFDVVLALNVLSSIPDPAHRTRVAAEMTRVLTRDGTVVWYDQRWPNPGNDKTRPVTRRDLHQLLPGADVALEPITLAPVLARTFPRLYHRLHRLPFLRSHLIGTIRPDPLPPEE